MVYSETSLRIKELFLKHGFEYHIAAKAYSGWHEAQDWQMQFLIRHGLKPHHNFLDIGCGWLRLAQALIPYLEPGHYFGIDSTEAHLAMGRELLDRRHFDANPTLLCDDRFSFERFNTSFDFAFCHAVFTHLSHDQIRECLHKLVPVMRPDGVLYVTFYLADRDAEQPSRYRRGGDGDLEYASSQVSLAFLGRLFAEIGIPWQHLGTEGHPTGHHVVGVRFGRSEQTGRSPAAIARAAARRVRRASYALIGR